MTRGRQMRSVTHCIIYCCCLLHCKSALPFPAAALYPRCKVALGSTAQGALCSNNNRTLELMNTSAIRGMLQSFHHVLEY